MTYYMVDVEADGPIPGDFSMVHLGAVIVEPGLVREFEGRLRPISEKWIPEALGITELTRQQVMGFEEPADVMSRFARWVTSTSRGRPMFISDNNGFDWGFVNWYLHHFTGSNPFGHSSQNLGSLYKGLVRDTFQNFLGLCSTEHNHHPVQDARANAEALLRMRDELGLKISLK